MVKVLLVYANSFMDNLIPIGISILSACLKESGHKTKLFDTTFYRTRDKTGDEARTETLQIKKTNLEGYGIHERKKEVTEDFKDIINEFKPNLIAVFVVETTYFIGLKLLNSIKNYNIPKIVGGMHATMSPKDVIKEESIEMICIGEGEKAIVELANKIENKIDYSHIDNLWVKKGKDIIKNPIGPLVKLDELPMQDWSIYEKERFYKPMGGKVWVCGPIELSRGCPHQCAYCCNAKLQKMYKGKGSYVRERKLEVFFEELKLKKKKYGLQYLYISSETFLQMSNERFDKFIEMYKDVKLPFWIQTRPETINQEKIEKLKEIGCEGITIGVEHGNEEFRRKILNRFVSNEVVIKAFEIAKKSGIRVSANSIVGFPTETRELFFDTVELNRELKVKNRIINIFCAYRGTQLWELAIEKNYISEDVTAGDYRLDAELNMPQLSKEAIKGLQRTFPLYVNFSKEMWPEIRKAEKFNKEGNVIFKKLSNIYKEKYLS